MYDDDTIRAELSVDAPEFSTKGLNPFYRLPAGELTCYADQALGALRAVQAYYDAAAGSDVGVEATASSIIVDRYKQQLAALCGDGSAYGAWPEPPGSRDRSQWPIPRKWRQASVKSFLETGIAKVGWSVGRYSSTCTVCLGKTNTFWWG